MQKQNPIDDLFRRKLEDYKVTPSVERRDAFIRDAEKVIAKRSSIRWWIVGLGAVLLISAGVGVLVIQEGRVEKRGNLHNESNEVKIFGKLNTEKNDKSSPIVKIINNEVKEKPVVPNKIASKSNAKNQLNVSKLNAKTQLNNELPLNNEFTKSRVSNDKSKNSSAVSVVMPPDRSQITAGTQHVSTAVVTDTSIMPSADQGQNVGPVLQNEEKIPDFREKSKLTKKWMFNAGISCSPEWMFNTFNGDKFVNNMGVEGTIHFGQFSVRTGVGLCITKGSNEMNVQTNPYLGTYDKLDSIVFRWDEKHNKLVSTIYTSVNNVYDTSVRNNYSYNKKRYTYLQVPLILGYDFWQNRWLSVGVRVGAVMSMLLKSENISSTYESGQNRIITINNVTPDRIQMNWQEIGGINAAFRLSRRFSIELEPDVKYYFNSIYESSPLIKKPWSMGLRTAFLVML